MGPRAPGPAEPVDFELLPDPIASLGAWIAAYGDVFQIDLSDGERAFVVTCPEEVGRVLVRGRYEKGRGIERVRLLLGEGLMTSEGGAWKRHRVMLQPFFRAGVLAAMRESFVARARALRDAWLEKADRGEIIDVTADTSAFALGAILEALFGQDAAALVELDTHGSLSMVANAESRDLAFAVRFRKLRRHIRALVLKRQSEAVFADDLLGQFLMAVDAEGAGLEVDELVDELMTMIIAGHETTAGTLGFAWQLLAEHPEAEARFHASLTAGSEGEGYVTQVLEEALRLYPPGWIVTRRALEADVLAGAEVAPGDHVFVPLYFLHRHPGHFSDAERFLPERFEAASPGRHPHAFLPFGVGPRRCIGEAFAMSEMRCHLVEIGRALSLRRVDAAPLRLEARVNLRAKDHLLLRARRRTQA